MSDKIQYDHGTFYGLRDCPKEPVTPEDFEGFGGSPLESMYERYDWDMKACIAARKKIENAYNLLPIQKVNSVYYFHDGKELKDGDIFDLPDGLEFKQDESQDELWEDVVNYMPIEYLQNEDMDRIIDKLKSKFTIKRKG